MTFEEEFPSLEKKQFADNVYGEAFLKASCAPFDARYVFCKDVKTSCLDKARVRAAIEKQRKHACVHDGLPSGVCEENMTYICSFCAGYFVLLRVLGLDESSVEEFDRVRHEYSQEETRRNSPDEEAVMNEQIEDTIIAMAVLAARVTALEQKETLRLDAEEKS